MVEPQPRSIRDATNQLERFLILRDNLTATEIQAIAPIVQRKIAVLPSCSLVGWHESEIETLEALTQLRIRLQTLEFDAGPVTEMIHRYLGSMRDEASAAELQTAYPGPRFPLVAYRLGAVDDFYIRTHYDSRNDRDFIPAQYVVFDQLQKRYDLLAILEAQLQPNQEVVKHSFSINNLEAVSILPRAPVRMHLVMNEGADDVDMILQVLDLETAAALSRQMKEEKPGLRADYWT